MGTQINPPNPKSLLSLERIQKIHDLAEHHKNNFLYSISHTFSAFMLIAMSIGILFFPIETLIENIFTFLFLPTFISLSFAFIVSFVLCPDISQWIQYACDRRKIEVLRKITLEVKNELQNSQNFEHRMVALVMNEKDPFKYANAETYRHLLRWRNGDNSPDVMQSVNDYVSNILGNISCKTEIEGDSEVLHRMSFLQTRCRTIENSLLIPALEKLPVLLAFSALTYMTQKGMEDPEFRNGLETLEVRVEGILETIRKEKEILKAKLEEAQISEKREILKLALEDTR
jgi:hypothetical protein